MRRPLMPSTKRERMVEGRGMSGRAVVVFIGEFVSPLWPGKSVERVRRPREGGDPSPLAFMKWLGVGSAPKQHRRRFWVPAFAGTTIDFLQSYSLSTIVTFAMPPPSHMVCRP